MTQNSKQDTARFNAASQGREIDRIRNEIEAMNRPLVKRGYERLETKENAKLEALRKDLEDKREESVKAIARDMLDEKIKESNAAPRPNGMLGPSREELAKAARTDAEASYERIVEERMNEAQKESMVRCREYLNEVQDRKGIREQHNEAAKGNSR